MIDAHYYTSFSTSLFEYLGKNGKAEKGSSQNNLSHLLNLSDIN